MYYYQICTFINLYNLNTYSCNGTLPDIADVSVEQAEERYNDLVKFDRNNGHPVFHGEFIAADCTKVDKHCKILKCILILYILNIHSMLLVFAFRDL